MLSSEKAALQQCFAVVCKELRCTEVVAQLFSKSILSQNEVQKLQQANLSTFERNFNFLMMFLESQADNAFKEFIDALEYTNQQHLASELRNKINEISKSQLKDAESPKHSEPNKRQVSDVEIVHALICVTADENQAFGVVKSEKTTTLQLFDIKTSKVEYYNEGAGYDWLAIQIKKISSIKEVLVALLLDVTAKRYVVRTIYQEAIELRTVREESLQGSTASFTEKRVAELQSAENQDLYAIISWERQLAPLRTAFTVVKIAVTDKEIRQQIIAENVSLEGSWFRPFFFGDRLNFLCATGYPDKVLKVKFEEQKTSYALRFSIFGINGTGESESSFPPFGEWSGPVIQDNQVYFCIKSRNRRTQEVWIIDFSRNPPLFRKCFEIHNGETGKTATFGNVAAAQLFLSQTGRAFFCSDRQNIISGFEKLANIYKGELLRVQQMEAIFSTATTLVIHGGEDTEKRAVFCLKLNRVLATTQAKEIFVYCSDNLIVEQYASNKNVTITPLDIFSRCPEFGQLFVYGLQSGEFTKHINIFLRRTDCSFIVLKDKLRSGLNSAKQRITYICLQQFSITESEIRTESQEIKKTLFKDCNEFIDAVRDPILKLNDGLEKAMGEFENVKTYCVPSTGYLTVAIHNAKGNSSKILTLAKKVEIDRFDAEKEFESLFLDLQIGGVLFYGLNLSLVLSSIKEIVSRPQCTNWQEIRPSELDFVFIHPKLGIFLVEIRANRLKFSKKAATNQLMKKASTLNYLIEVLTGTYCEIHNLLYYPLMTLRKKSIEESTEEMRERKITTLFNSENKKQLLKDFFTELKHSDQNEYQRLENLTLALTALRTMIQLKESRNVLMIRDSNFIPHFTENKMNPLLFLTSEQLKILSVQRSERLQVIFGPPGSGKTLLIILSAIRAARKRFSKGRVVLVTSRFLVDELVQHFDANHDDVFRKPLVQTHLDILDSDDAFCDEIQLNSSSDWFFERRWKAKGKTVIALQSTSSINAAKLIEFKKRYPEVPIHKLSVVLRNRKTIVEQWTKLYDDINDPLEDASSSDFMLEKAFNSLCMKQEDNNPVVPEETKGRLETYNKVVDMLKKFVVLNEEAQQSLITSTNNPQQGDYRPCDVAVITTSQAYVEKLLIILAQNEIPCGSISEQMANPNIVTVLDFEQALSREWPLVIVVSFGENENMNKFSLIAYSRAIMKLIIIEMEKHDSSKATSKRSSENSDGTK